MGVKSSAVFSSAAAYKTKFESGSTKVERYEPFSGIINLSGAGHLVSARGIRTGRCSAWVVITDFGIWSTNEPDDR